MRRCAGFTYLTAIFIVAFMGVGSMLIGTAWHNEAMRDKEAELLHIGNAYRRAIERYYLAGEQRRYPRTLEELVKDPRLPATQRYIRQLYPDPITNSSEWGIIKAPDGGIAGVHSKSELEPLKKTNFKLREREFQGAKSYADWKFIFTPTAAQSGAKPAPKGRAPAPQPQTQAPPPAGK